MTFKVTYKFDPNVIYLFICFSRLMYFCKLDSEQEFCLKKDIPSDIRSWGRAFAVNRTWRLSHGYLNSSTVNCLDMSQTPDLFSFSFKKKKKNCSRLFDFIRRIICIFMLLGMWSGYWRKTEWEKNEDDMKKHVQEICLQQF